MTKFFKVIPLLVFACMSYISYAKSVDENTAKTIGAHYLISVGVGDVKSEADLATSYIATATIGGKVINDYYVFNTANGKGFVMVSGDDLVQPILAYSGEAPFNYANISPSAKDWVNGYKNQITYVLEHNLPAQDGVPQQWKDLKVASMHVAARTTSSFPSSTYFLLTTTWDQAPKYNYLCPGSGATKAYTGCVATAMAQVMKYWNWPTVGTGLHTYTPVTNGSLYGSLTADFGNTAYNWAGMPNAVTTNNYNVGILMLHAGVSTNMDYGYSASGSGTYVIYPWSPILNCAEFALPTYFRYKPSLKGLSRDPTPGGLPAISQAAWISYLKTELDANRPVIYAGQGTSGGHCWVADGYDLSSNMHFNWGWGGVGPNGFYSVNSIAPPSLGAGGGGGDFNTQQSIIIGILPDSNTITSTSKLEMLAHLDCPTNSPINYMGTFSLATKVLNTGTTTFKGDFCVQVFDASNNLAATVQTITGQTITAGDSTATLNFSTAGLWAMIPGKYGLMLMCRATGTTAWTPVVNNGIFVNYNSLDVQNSQVIELYDSLHVGSHTVVKGSAMSVTTKVADLGTSNFGGNVEAVLISTSTAVAYPIQIYTGQTINAYVFQNYTFATSAITAPPGQYVLAVRHETVGTSSYIVTGSDLYENPIIINVVAPAAINTVSSNAGNILVYPNPAKDMINIDPQGISVREIHISDMQGRQVKKLVPGAGQSVLSVPVNDLSSGMYFVELLSGDNVITKKIVITK